MKKVPKRQSKANISTSQTAFHERNTILRLSKNRSKRHRCKRPEVILMSLTPSLKDIHPLKAEKRFVHTRTTITD